VKRKSPLVIRVCSPLGGPPNATTPAVRPSKDRLAVFFWTRTRTTAAGDFSRGKVAAPAMSLVNAPVRDVTAVATLVATAIVVAWPVLTGGFLTYVDNPVHIAELTELARLDSGWSDLAFTGLPLGTLHSPLWYPVLALLARLGLPIEPLYRGVLLASFCAPPLALFAVARRFTSTVPAMVLAYLLLVQAPNLRGVGAPLAGMWTHALGTAGVILLADLVSRPRLDAKRHLALATLLALVALTHLFALLAASVLIVIASVRLRLLDPGSNKEVWWRARDCGVAALASAVYWLTFLRTTRPDVAPLDVLGLDALAVRLLLPCNVLYLLDGQIERAIHRELYLTDAVPMVGLVLLGSIGRMVRSERAAALGRIGFWVAIAFLSALAIHAVSPNTWLGPVPWRHLDWVRVGLALSAIPLLEHWRLRRAPESIVFPALVVLAFWWGRPLALDAPAGKAEERAALRKTWDFIREHADPSWGRLYTLDTFGGRWERGGLAHSHVLVLTHRETGVRQLGTYYGVVPYRTRWTLSEFNRLFQLSDVSADGLVVLMNKTNARAVLASTEAAARWFESTDRFDRLFREDPFSVWRLRDGPVEWIAPLRPSNRVARVSFEDGLVRFVLESERPRARVVVKATWHPWWRLEGPPGAKTVETPDGFLGILDIPQGRHEIALRYEEDPWPARLSAFGWVALLVWGVRVGRWRRS
jgi:hypothetical protein